MPLETATYINQLDAANPLGSDPIASGDDHLRLIKAALKATFPNITGPVTPTQAVLNNPFPIGGIILWSGSVASVPSGWALCNGSNGTPDLRDRFVVGAGSAYAVGATGGANEVTLNTTQIPSHTHSVTASTDSQGAHSHGVNDPGHSHSISFNRTQKSNNATPFMLSDPNVGENNNGTATYSVTTATTGISIASAGAHTHSITGTAAATGGGLAHENRPPYYALAYIMKV